MAEKIFRRLQFLLLLFVFALPASAQYKCIYKMDVTDGLSQNTINSIYQDEHHYLWFGTSNGLNLYNGKDFVVLKNDKDNPFSLANNEIKELDGDLHGHIFIRAGNSQILRYSISTGIYDLIVPSNATSMYYDGGLYYACSHEIWFLPDQTPDAELLYAFEDKGNVVTSLCRKEEGLYIGTTRKGLYLLQENGTVMHILQEGYVSSITADSHGELWVTFQDNQGLVRIRDGKAVRYRSSETDPATINCDRTQVCCEDMDGNMWIGTFKGITRFDRKTEKFTRYENPVISDNSIISILSDHQGTIWAGTYYLGVYYFNPFDQIYNVFHTSSNGYAGLSSDVVGEMVEDSRGRVWMATERGGLDCYDPASGKIRSYSLTEGLGSDIVKSLYLDESAGYIWMGTHLGGLSRLDLARGRVRNYRHVKGDDGSLPSDIVSDVIPYGDKLLVAARRGVVILDKRTGKCRPLFENEDHQKLTHYCNQLLLDSRGNLWMVHASNGVYRYDFSSGLFNTFRNTRIIPNGISPGKVNAIYEDSKGRIWLCNNQNGLDCYDYGTGNFRNYDVKKSHLSSNALYAIAELEQDEFIVTADNGYSIFKCSENRSVNFQNNRNIPLVSANERSLLVASDGQIYIGGMNGMISFDRKDVSTIRRNYEIYPYRLNVDGKKVTVNDDSGILEEDLSSAGRIVIGPEVSTFSLEYAVTDYLPYDNDEIYYRLEGFSDIWHKMDASRTITFTNLNFGKYRLLVRTDAGTGGAQEKDCGLSIVVRPPFYLSVWAFLIYGLVFAFILYLSFNLYNNRIRLQEAVKYEKKHTREIEELNQYKLRFFTNISHEFRTPLSVIIAQIEMMMDKYHSDMSIYSPLNRIYRCCVQLKELVSELLDFRKQEQGYMKLKVKSSDIVDFVHEQYLIFQVYAKQRGLTYKFIKAYDEIPLWFDSKQMQKVINNLIFNAFKHVSPHGRIVVSITRDEEYAVIDIINTGKGIRPEEIDKIFNRFYQIDAKDEVGAGTGIGLALSKGIVESHHGTIKVFSELDKETIFRVSLPLGKEHFSDEELVSEETSEQDIHEENLSAGKLPVSAGMMDCEQTELSSNDAATRGNAKVLVVEDNVPLREMLVQLFGPFYHVLQAGDGAEGLEMIRETMPDLVISDVMMPNMDGLELCRRVKSDDLTAHIPVVLLTARTEDSQKLEGLKYGADDYIVKPFSSRELVSRCNNIINNREILRQKFSSSAPQEEKQKVVANNRKDLDFVSRASGIIRSHMAEPDFRLEDLARELGVSRTKLFTRLKEVQGVTPMEFMMDIRLSDACRLLKNEPDLNISEISDRTGFSSPKFFRKCFKDKYGMTPLAYRKTI